MGKGIVFCGGQWGSSFCVAKLIEVILSILLIVLIFIDAFCEIRYRGSFFYGFSQILHSFMLITLICNIVYNLDHNFDTFFYLESLFYDWYFLTLVSYITNRIFTKSKTQSTNKIRVLRICYIVLMITFLAIFIYSVIEKIKQCKEVWFLVIDTIGLALCAAIVLIGYQHHQQEVKKMIDYTDQSKISNPLSRMWILIAFNVFCQIINLIESLVYITHSDRCRFTNNRSMDTIIKLIFSIFTLHMSCFCTVAVLYVRRRNQQKQLSVLERSHTFDYQYNYIEMVPNPVRNSSQDANSI